jgi:Rieske Fe-S protein
MSQQAESRGVDQPGQPDRRRFLASGAVATGAMAGGLALGYGMFIRCAGQYLYPSDEGTAWMFVSDVASVAPGQAIAFQSPTGVPVVITRKSQSEANEAATSADFLALSSVCPHLGCRVHWEPQNDRFFCPCHLGTFDPEGRPTGGPPLAANQSLPDYPLRVENGLLYINMPVEPIDQTTYRVVGEEGSSEQGAGSVEPTSESDSLLPAPRSELRPGGLA